MSTTVHFLDVGQGNMTLIQTDDGKVLLYDCNVTDKNEKLVLGYLRRHIGSETGIHRFICSHRDADHMRGVMKVHASFPIGLFWEAGVPGTTTDNTEYQQYMRLRREVGCKVVERQTYYDFGKTRLRIMNAQNDTLPDDANAQSVVVKVVQRHKNLDAELRSVLLTGDTDARVWKDCPYPVSAGSHCLHTRRL
jgi:beta-lactamase superfamily II metal-dependent hydrolase